MGKGGSGDDEVRRGERDEEVGEGEADEVIRFGSGCGATDCRTRRAGQSAGRVCG